MPTPLVQLDARGLEPPQPMMKILEAVAALPAEATLAARTDRQPMLLYPQLEQRGFTYETVQQSDGTHLTHIHRR
jgi:TusA-related sulfurtransferase